MKILVLLLATLVTLTGIGTGPVLAADLPKAQSDKGLVVFYRAKSMKGGAVHLLIRTSEGAAGNLTNGSMFYHYYEPGQRTFDVSTPSVAGSDLISLDIKAGQAYYIRGEILMGWPVGRPKLSQESESAARKAVSKL